MSHKGAPPPGHGQRFSMFASEVTRAVNAGNVEHAVNLSQAALREGFTHPIFLNLLAYREMHEGRPRKALDLLMGAKAMAPGDMNILNAIGTCHAALGDFPAALHAYNAAIAGAPHLAPAYYNRGVAHDTVGNFALARADFERAVALRPEYPEALARLAYCAAVSGAYETARIYAQTALKYGPAQPVAVMACAMADIADGDYIEAELLLSSQLSQAQLSDDNRAILLGLIGDARDGADDTPGAFRAYSESNGLMHSIYSRAMVAAAPEPPREQVERLTNYFAAASRDLWKARNYSPPPGRRAPMFLVGFPRSGTTLLEQALAGHPSVVTSEERELLTDAITDFIVPRDGLMRLERLSPEDAAHYRGAYWKRAGTIASTDKQFIDKLPLNTLYLPLVAKIFPEAKIIFARRDPRDVVFSCFRRRFAMTPQMFELLNLENAARYYDAVMHLAELYRTKLNLAWKDVVYENVVNDFEGEMRDLCAFLGLEWDSMMGDFAARLAARGVDTPSSGQLVKGLNSEGIGSWRRYREQMTPILSLLEPWVNRLGYFDK